MLLVDLLNFKLILAQLGCCIVRCLSGNLTYVGRFRQKCIILLDILVCTIADSTAKKELIRSLLYYLSRRK